ncbi:hypothetical protein GDO81_025478 [Engystomops pustulosus]|uniref:Secreted protein n=1 Tax=Engystomops pustulosus TaxID=76066 RepID=A0AAV6YLD5_ENGPU|nr:hypothetical protein GDO81_025478 [Engystomops pustulosus]
MPFMFTPRRGFLLLFLYYTGLLPFVDLPESVVETYMPSLINRTYFPHNSLMRNRFLVYLQDKLMMRKSLFQHLQDRGIQVTHHACHVTLSAGHVKRLYNVFYTQVRSYTLYTG